MSERAREKGRQPGVALGSKTSDSASAPTVRTLRVSPTNFGAYIDHESARYSRIRVLGRLWLRNISAQLLP